MCGYATMFFSARSKARMTKFCWKRVSAPHPPDTIDIGVLYAPEALCVKLEQDVHGQSSSLLACQDWHKCRSQIHVAIWKPRSPNALSGALVVAHMHDFVQYVGNNYTVRYRNLRARQHIIIGTRIL